MQLPPATVPSNRPAPADTTTTTAGTTNTDTLPSAPPHTTFHAASNPWGDTTTSNGNGARSPPLPPLFPPLPVGVVGLGPDASPSPPRSNIYPKHAAVAVAAAALPLPPGAYKVAAGVAPTEDGSSRCPEPS